MMVYLGLAVIFIALVSFWNHLNFLGINLRYLLNSIKATRLLE